MASNFNRRKQMERINGNITAEEVRVVHEERGSLGVMSLRAALDIAESEGIDLVEIAPTAIPPVCKLIDYGKHRFEIQKRDKEARKKQKTVKLKEIKLRPKISGHDYNFKMNHVRDFLEDGDKVKITVMFRGREMSHIDIGREIINKVMEDLKEESIIEKPAKLEGRNLTMVLSPSKQKKVKTTEANDNKEPTGE